MKYKNDILIYIFINFNKGLIEEETADN
jgi:hypothetical protein